MASQNPVLIEMHARVVERVARYIVAYWQHRVDLGRSDLEHGRITEALEMNDDALAVALLRSHRTHGLAKIHEIMNRVEAT